MTDKKTLLFYFVLLGIGALFGTTLLVVPPQFLSFFLGLCVLSGLAVFCLVNPTLLLYFVIIASAAGGLVQDLGKLDAGSTEITVSGLQWLFIAGICVLFVGFNLRYVRLPGHLYPFLFFVIWVIVRWATSSFNLVGMKDVLFYTLPFLTCVYTLAGAKCARKMDIEKIGAALLMSVTIPVSVVVILVSLGQLDLEAKGPTGLVHPRTIALHLVVILAFSVAQWRYGGTASARRWGGFVSILALGTILFTLSRMASLTALLVVATAKLDPRKLWKLLPTASVGAVIFGLVLFHVPWFRQRSFFSEDVKLSDSFEHLNTAGRADQFWPLTSAHALQKPVFGWGPGGARIFLGRVGRKVVDKWEPSDYHPHNEYLQVYHDMGIPGLGLMLLTWGALLSRCWRDWRQAHLSRNTRAAKWSMAATVNLAAILFTIITDNTLHFAFVTTPVFIIVACTELLNRPYWQLSPSWEKQVRKDRSRASPVPVRYRFSPASLTTS